MRTTAEPPAPIGDPLTRRRRVLTLTLVLAVGLAAGGATASLWVKSPQDQLAETSAPALSTLTVPVTRKVLENKVTTRGKVAPAQTFAVNAGASGAGAAIVTAVRVKAGDAVKAGDVLIEIAARPLFALPGGTPAYRDLKPGAKGADVKQLQQALRGLGHDPGESVGVFGPGTKRALESFYRSKGFEPAIAGDAKAVEAARRALTEARRVRDDAATALEDAERAGDEVAVRDARRALTRAEEDLRSADDAHATATTEYGAMLPLSEVVFLPGFPARVDMVAAALGAAPPSPALTLSAGRLAVVAELSAAERRLLETGMTAELALGNKGEKFTGVIAGIESGADEAGEGRGAFRALIEPDATIPAQLSGESALVTIRASSTSGAVLTVPIAALYGTADGGTHVIKVAADGTQTPVDVRLGLSGNGLVEVQGEGLSEGDMVRVGVTDRDGK